MSRIEIIIISQHQTNLSYIVGRVEVQTISLSVDRITTRSRSFLSVVVWTEPSFNIQL